MPKNPNNDEHSGVQIRVWLPESLYDLIVARSEERGTSRAEEVRNLVIQGVKSEIRRDRELDHLERIAWRGTMETITLLEILGPWLRGSVAGDNLEQKTKEYQRQLGIARKRATDRLRQELQELDDDYRD